MDGREKILAEIGSEPVSGFYLRPGAERLIERVEAVGGNGVASSYPPPSVSSRDGVQPAGWPGPVIALAAAAESLGWRFQLAYASGCMPHATTGRPGAERESFSVQFARGGYQGYAIYAGKAWQSIMVTGRDLPPFGKLGRTDLGAWLREPWPGGDVRYAEVLAYLDQQERDRKAREECNRGVHDSAVLLGRVFGMEVAGPAGVWCRRCEHGWVGDPWRKPKGKGEAL